MTTNANPLSSDAPSADDQGEEAVSETGSSAENVENSGVEAGTAPADAEHASTPEGDPPRTNRAIRMVGSLALLALGFAGGGIVFSTCSNEETPNNKTEHAAHEGEIADDVVWTCSMHPQIRQGEPGQCPICGMDLIRATSEGEDNASSAERIVLSERARTLARLRTSTVGRQAHASADLRLLGRLEANETSLKTVTSWIDGRIDKLHVKVTGKRVRAGQTIATLYSPEVYAAHQDLLVAKRQVKRMATSSELSRRSADAALEAARERLALLGVTDAEIGRMAGKKRPTRAVSIRSPFSGTVIERLATEGTYVETGATLYRIANLKTLWVQLDAYESDLARISVGQSVEVRVEAVPGESFQGTVTFIDPVLDPKRRTARVRVQLDNSEGRLRPGMFAEATVATEHPEGAPRPLVVPATAPLFTGRRAIVYVEVDEGDRLAYEARTVRLGPRLGQVYPVVAGLAEGDRVVTRGAFALDADLQIRGGASMMTSSDDLQEGAWDSILELSDAERAPLEPVVESYLRVQNALASDDLGSATKAARDLVEASIGAKVVKPAEAKDAWKSLAGEIRGHGEHVAKATTIEHAREGFESLSDAVIVLIGRFGNPLDVDLRLAHCPMAASNEGALWLQEAAKVENPYFGAAMLDCGELRKNVAPGGYLRPPSSPAPQVARPAAGGHQH